MRTENHTYIKAGPELVDTKIQDRRKGPPNIAYRGFEGGNGVGLLDKRRVERGTYKKRWYY